MLRGERPDPNGFVVTGDTKTKFIKYNTTPSRLADGGNYFYEHGVVGFRSPEVEISVWFSAESDNIPQLKGSFIQSLQRLNGALNDDVKHRVWVPDIHHRRSSHLGSYSAESIRHQEAQRVANYDIYDHFVVPAGSTITPHVTFTGNLNHLLDFSKPFSDQVTRKTSSPEQPTPGTRGNKTTEEISYLLYERSGLLVAGQVGREPLGMEIQYEPPFNLPVRVQLPFRTHLAENLKTAWGYAHISGITTYEEDEPGAGTPKVKPIVTQEENDAVKIVVFHGNEVDLESRLRQVHERCNCGNENHVRHFKKNLDATGAEEGTFFKIAEFDVMAVTPNLLINPKLELTGRVMLTGPHQPFSVFPLERIASRCPRCNNRMSQVHVCRPLPAGYPMELIHPDYTSNQ